MSKCKPKTRFIPATCAWALLLGATSLFFVYICGYLAKNYHFAIPICQGVITIFVLANFTLATFMDPGIIPKAWPDETKDDDFRVPLYKNVEISGITVRMKWCTTCRFYRPPRCSHCSVCNNCIETFDHHCPWVNNCIGRRNYRHFFLFLVSLSIHMISIFAFCVVFLLDHTKELQSVNTIICISIMVIIFCLIFPILGLTGFHVVLVSRGRTTNEQVTGKFRGGYNPFSRGCCSNIVYSLCGPMYPRYRKGRRKRKTSRVPFTEPPISTITAENQVRVYMDTSNGVRTSNLNAYNKMSQGPHISDTDITMEAVDATQSQSQDCEPTPPCQRDGSKTNLFDYAEFREALATNASRQNHLPSRSEPPVKLVSSRNPAASYGAGNPHRSPHPRPRAFGDSVRSRSNTPDPLSPDGSTSRNIVGSPTAARGIHSPGTNRTPPSLSSPVRRSNPGTPTSPRSPGFGKRRTEVTSPGGDGRPILGHPVYPEAIAARQRHGGYPHAYEQVKYDTIAQPHGLQGTPVSREVPRSISPQRKFASESELIRPVAGEHPNPHYFRTGNHTSDNLHDLASSPVKSVSSGWREAHAYNPHVHHPAAQQYGPSHYATGGSVTTGYSPSARGDYWSHPTSPTSGVTTRPPPFSGYGRRNSGSTSPQPKRKFYLQQQQQSLPPPQWSTHSKDGTPLPPGASRVRAARPMSFVRALEVSDNMEMTPTRVLHSPGGTPKTEHRLGYQQTTSPPGQQPQQQEQDGDRKSFYDTNYEISV